jgi:riboflavin synthase
VFTGIIEEIGMVQAVRRVGHGARVEIRAPGAARTSRAGDSIAVDGACLTVTECDATAFACDVSAETLVRTTLGARHPGDPVNLERPLRVGDRLGGHLVTGHVDGVGTLLRRRPQEPGELVHIRAPRDLAPLIALKGSVAVDGISLTVAELDAEVFGVALIPFTASRTTLGRKRVGDAVNLETDLIAKHVARLRGFEPAAGLTLEKLEEYGYS